MAILHPVFTLLVIFVIIGSFMEVYSDSYKKYPLALGIIGFFMIVFIGLRGFVGADYGVYRILYNIYFPTIEFSELMNKATFGRSKVEEEWLYIFLNKLVFFTGSPFYIFTLVSAIITLGIKFLSYSKNSVYPIFSVMLFIFPSYFIADSGHMRQALGMVFCLAAFKFIKERNLWLYLLCMYVAIGFHKSAIIFLPMFWLVKVPLNSYRIFLLIGVSILLSPFQIYNFASVFLNSLSVQDLSNGINGYIDYEARTSTFMDGYIVVFCILVIVFNKVACERILYYEYMRNIVVMGLCMYFIMRDNPVFSTRLVGSFMCYIPLVIPNIVASIREESRKKLLHLYFVMFTVFYYFVFASFQGDKGRFTPSTYENVLWRT